MQVITGTGQSAWHPERLYLDCFTSATAPTPSEILMDELDMGRFTYGPLGACQGAAITLSEYPAAWIDAPNPRLIRPRLVSEHGTGYVHAGVLDTFSTPLGDSAEGTLLAPHRLYGGTPGATFGQAGLTAGVRTYIAGFPVPQPELDRVASAEALLGAYPNSEFGVGPDLYAVLGRPELANFATYTIDCEAMDLINLGYQPTGAPTDAYFDPGDGWAKKWHTRAGVPPLVPRVALPVRIDRPIVEITQYPNLGSGWVGSVSSAFYTDQIFEYTGNYPVNYEYIRNVGLIVKGQFTVSGINALVLSDPYAASMLTVTIEIDGAAVGQVGPIQLTESMIGLIQNYEFDVSSSITGPGNYPVKTTLRLTPGTNSRTYFYVGGPQAKHTFATPNYADVQMPLGWDAPFQVGPSYSFLLYGWHVPPFRVIIPQSVCGVPGGLIQYAATATVTVTASGGVTTLITTAARPYRGQRRGGLSA